MNKSKDSTWGVKQMMERAIVEYSLTDGYPDSPNSQRANYEKQIRRILRESGLVKKNTKTGNYDYILPERKAKNFIDVIMRTYFEERVDETKLKEKYAKIDAELNEKHYKTVTESEEDYSHYDERDPDPTPTSNEIDASIDRFMLRAIFAQFYYFDEEKYRRDYIERSYSVIQGMLEPFVEGYSLLNERLSNPIKYYCTRRL